MYGVEHVFQGIGRVGIVYDGSHSLVRAYRLQSSADALQCAEHQEYVLLAFAEHPGGTIYGEQVADIEFTDELDTNLLSVDVEIHSLEVALQDMGFIVGHLAC